MYLNKALRYSPSLCLNNQIVHWHGCHHQGHDLSEQEFTYVYICIGQMHAHMYIESLAAL